MIRPRDTLRYLNERGGRRWWLPALLAVLMAVLPVIVGAPMAAEQAREAVLANQERMAEQQGTELSEEQRAQMEGVVASPLIIVVFPAVAGVLGLVVGWLMWSGVLYLTGMVFGGRSTFGALFRVVVWTWWPYVLRGLLQTAYIAVSRQLILNPGLSGFVSSVSSADEIIVASPNMGQLVLSSLLARVDLFLFWRLALVVVGTVVVMRISWRKAVLIVGLIWLLLTALGVLPALVGGMFSGLMAAG
jgi:hypothetical protein